MFQAIRGKHSRILANEVQADAFRKNGWNVQPAKQQVSPLMEDELKALHNEANSLGIVYKPNIGIDKLRARIEEFKQK